MFTRRRSVHGRSMGSVRSAQQKCVRRGLLEPLILLHMEHLISAPDMSRAAITRLQVIAAEDIGLGAPGLLPTLCRLERGWSGLDRQERARRLIQAAKLCVVDVEASRFLPCWLVTLVQGVQSAQPRWRSLEELLESLSQAIENLDLDQAGSCLEEIFLRHPLPGEEPLPDPVGFSALVTNDVWRVLQAGLQSHQAELIEACQRCFGPPSRRSIASRLFLYLALVARVTNLPAWSLSVPTVSDAEVHFWLKEAGTRSFEFPDWVFDRHTAQGKRMGRGYAHFFEEAVLLAHPSSVLGAEREREVFQKARTIYLEAEERHGRRAASTSNMRKRWRSKVA